MDFMPPNILYIHTVFQVHYSLGKSKPAYSAPRCWRSYQIRPFIGYSRPIAAIRRLHEVGSSVTASLREAAIVSNGLELCRSSNSFIWSLRQC